MKLFRMMLLCAAMVSTTVAFGDTVMSEEWKACARQAQIGDSEAQYRMGIMYKDGKFVEKNPVEAFYWFRKSASNGNGDAMLEVGRCFREGDGVIADSRIAAENYWRAAEKGNAEGAYRYAEMLRDGVGVSQDKGKAFKWFNFAAEKNYSDARQQAEKLRGYAKSSKVEKRVADKKQDGVKRASRGKKHSKKTRKK